MHEIERTYTPYLHSNTLYRSYNRIEQGCALKKKETCRLHQGAWMTSPLSHYLLDSQTLHGVDDITTLHF